MIIREVEEAYQVMFDDYVKNIKVGDSVKVMRKTFGGELGSDIYWNSAMDETVGVIGTVAKISGNSIRVQFSAPINSSWYYPWFCLEKIAGPEITVIVGTKSYTVSKDKVDKIIELIEDSINDEGYDDDGYNDDDYDSEEPDGVYRFWVRR